jgi:hypothetical protein
MSTAVGLTRDKPIQLHQEIAEGLPPVWVDRTRVRQVLLNLLANAAKFTERGYITVRAEPQAQHVLVSVRDTGPGIPAADRTRIFESYVKGRHDDQHGVGLGLAITRQLVDMHGGSIWVDSEPGHGSTFYFTLPRASTPVSDQPGLANFVHQGPAALNESLVLVVDSDRGTYRCLAKPLAESGFRVAGLTDPSLIVGKVSHLHPLAVVFDAWQVPGANYVLRNLRENWPGLPLLSAAYHPADDQGLLADESGVMSRLEQGDFVDHITAWLHRHRS